MKKKSFLGIGCCASLVCVLLVSCQAVGQAALKKVRPAQEKGFPKYRGQLFLGETVSIVDLPIQPFKLKTPDGKVVSNDQLLGKVVVLDFWSTWCSPCKKLTAELSSAFQQRKFFKRSDFQMIGVNYNEDLVSKGGDPIKYWKEHGYKFPMTVNNNAYGKSISAGNPTIVVIGKDGIVKGRWDAWTPSTAREVSMFTSVLLDNPEIGIEDISRAAAAGDYEKAEYFSSAFLAKYPEEVEYVAPLRFSILMEKSQSDALYFIRPVLINAIDYKKIVTAIVQSEFDKEQATVEAEFKRTELPTNYVEDIMGLTKDRAFDYVVERANLQYNADLFIVLSEEALQDGDKEGGIAFLERALKIISDKINSWESESKRLRDRLKGLKAN
ncbi:TlpA family protein disulfide reductase [Chryseolinea soli]|nr:TlpA disulfide reductase family protein [Chryseolinea soli]